MNDKLSMKKRFKRWLAGFINANVDDEPREWSKPESLVQLYKDVTAEFMKNGKHDHYYLSSFCLHKCNLVGTPMYKGIRIQLSISAARRYPVCGIIEIVDEDIIQIMDDFRDGKLVFPESMSTIGDEYPICFPMDGFPHAERVHQYIPEYTVEFKSPGGGVAPQAYITFTEVEAAKNGDLNTCYSIDDLTYMLALMALNIQKGKPEIEDECYDEDDDR